MARMPGAVWKPIPASKSRISSYDLVCIHTMVGSLAGTDGYFRNIAPGINSHFGTGGYGEIWQWVDTSVRSGANLNGNHHIISIENADMGPGFAAWNTRLGSAVPHFTDAQCEAIAKILAWAYREHGIPLVLVPDSKPGRRGICYHRQGVPGYMVAGGEKWSNAQGKVCPGDRRVSQIPGIIKRARQIVGLEAGGEDEMNASQEKLLREVHEVLRAGGWFRGSFTFTQEMDNIANAVAGSRDWARKAAGGVEGVLAQAAAQEAVIRQLASAVASGGGVDEEALLRHISAEVNGAKESIRQALAEGYDVKLEPKSGE